MKKSLPTSPAAPSAACIGVLALQGDIEKHHSMLRALGLPAREIRRTGDLEHCRGLILPGGESTTMGKLLARTGLLEEINRRLAQGLPVYGTCAGLILLAREITGYDQPGFRLLDVAVTRNAYGRQVESFEADIDIGALNSGKPLRTKGFRAVFIRAPLITRVGPGVQVLAEFEGAAVLVRQGNILASSFHPELTADLRIHAWFASTLCGLPNPVTGHAAV